MLIKLKIINYRRVKLFFLHLALEVTMTLLEVVLTLCRHRLIVILAVSRFLSLNKLLILLEAQLMNS